LLIVAPLACAVMELLPPPMAVRLQSFSRLSCLLWGICCMCEKNAVPNGWTGKLVSYMGVFGL
jgi:hypothetical protein